MEIPVYISDIKRMMLVDIALLGFLLGYLIQFYVSIEIAARKRVAMQCQYPNVSLIKCQGVYRLVDKNPKQKFVNHQIKIENDRISLYIEGNRSDFKNLNDAITYVRSITH